MNPLGSGYHTASGLTLNNISGHRNGCATECPGTNLYNQLPAIRNAVYDLLNPTSVQFEENLPEEFHLAQNYPNPFNPSTTIRFVIPNEVRNLKDFSSQTPRNDNTLVTLKVYDVLGNEVAVLVNENKPAGNYQIEFDASGLSSGVYFYSLMAEDIVQTRKMILLQ
ncbi:MAG: T9SS type A sorting domain-containing protein [Ignavibacterium sp.]|nr:T9SS type A sorting domain-containing protein [Ignavibacterium sp.]